MSGPRLDLPDGSDGVEAPPIDTLVGLRADDLGMAERRTLAVLRRSPDGSREHQQALALARILSELPAPPATLHASDVLARLARRRRLRAVGRRLAVSVLLVTTAGLGLVGWRLGLPAPAPPGAVTLEASATVHGVHRPIGHGNTVPADAGLELAVATGTPGALFVTERYGYGTVRPIAPTSGRWEVPAGLHRIATPIRPDTTPRTTLYEAWLCPLEATTWSPATCRRDRLEVRWR